jgi:hypothetical protein
MFEKTSCLNDLLKRMTSKTYHPYRIGVGIGIVIGVEMLDGSASDTDFDR